jgi:hypothetical protein
MNGAEGGATARQHRVLRAVACDGRWSALRAHGLDLDAVTLAEAGLVRIVHDRHDDRCTTVELLPAGQEVFACL